jgi:5-bromo-4-chloroindolyl phosphate hydrolysis protein
MINQPFFQVALPLIVTILVAAFTAVWSSNKRIDEISHRLDDTNRRLDHLESAVQDVLRALMAIDHRLTVLEERGFPLVRG